MESKPLELFKKRTDVALSDMVWSGHRHGLMIGLDDFIGLSNRNDSMIHSMILWKSGKLVSTINVMNERFIYRYIWLLLCFFFEVFFVCLFVCWRRHGREMRKNPTFKFCYNKISAAFNLHFDVIYLPWFPPTCQASGGNSVTPPFGGSLYLSEHWKAPIIVSICWDLYIWRPAGLWLSQFHIYFRKIRISLFCV